VVNFNRQHCIIKCLANGFLLAEDCRVEGVRKMKYGFIGDLVLLSNAHHMLSSCIKKDATDEL